MKNKKKSIPVPTIEHWTTIQYETALPIDFVKLIDKNYNSMIVYIKKTGRAFTDLREVLIRWGVWSRDMNTILRKRINIEITPLEHATNEFERDDILGKQKLKTHLKLAYAYWWNRTHSLEMYRKSFFGKISDRKNIDSGMNTIKGMLMADFTEEYLQEKYPHFYDLVNRLSKKKELTEEETKAALDGGIAPVNDF